MSRVLKIAAIGCAVVVAALGVLELFAGDVSGFTQSMFTAAGIVLLVSDR